MQGLVSVEGSVFRAFRWQDGLSEWEAKMGKLCFKCGLAPLVLIMENFQYIDEVEGHE